MTAKIYQFPDLMPKKSNNTIQAYVDEVIAEIIRSPTLTALDDKLMLVHGGRMFNYQLSYADEEIDIVINLKFVPQE